MPEQSPLEVVISPDDPDDPRYEELAADLRARGFDVRLAPAFRRKGSVDLEAFRDVLIWVNQHLPDAVLAAVVADVWNRLRRGGEREEADAESQSGPRRARIVEIYGPDGTYTRFAVEEDEPGGNPQQSAIVHAEVLDQLERLARLRDSGDLTDDEFEQQKKQLLRISW
jgi:transposase